jgi:hypothetical protein
VRRWVSAPEPHNAPHPQWDAYEALARRTLERFATQSGPEQDTLRAQIAAAQLNVLEYSGAGFFLELGVPAETPRLSTNGIVADTNAWPNGAAFDDFSQAIGLCLVAKDGVLSHFEAHSFVDWPEDVSGYVFET